ncbi:hypothetical protein BJ742DRAFT_891530 [Cladochytrium replicatum]|nr:hypothetical protein BJ742DRAFT_891530 [Cladochytrium replicatum]
MDTNTMHLRRTSCPLARPTITKASMSNKRHIFFRLGVHLIKAAMFCLVAVERVMDHEPSFESTSAPHMFGSIRGPRKQHTRILPRNPQTRSGPFAPDPRLFATHPPADPPLHSSHQFLEPTDLIRPLPYPRPKEYTLRPLTPKNFPPSGSTGTVIPLKKPRVLAGVRMDPSPRPQPMTIATPALPPHKREPRRQSSDPSENGINDDDQPSLVSVTLAPASTNNSTTHFRKPSESALALDSISGWADDPSEDEVATFLTASAVSAYSYVTSSSPLLASGSYGVVQNTISQERTVLEKGVGGCCVACGGSETPIPTPPSNTVAPAMRLLHLRRNLREAVSSAYLTAARAVSPTNGANTECSEGETASLDSSKSYHKELSGQTEQGFEGESLAQRKLSPVPADFNVTESARGRNQSASVSTERSLEFTGRGASDRPSSPTKPLKLVLRPKSAAYESLSPTTVIPTVNRPFSAEAACGLAIQAASARHPRQSFKTQGQRPAPPKNMALPTQTARRMISVHYDSSQPPMKAVLTGRKYYSQVNVEMGRERRLKGHIQYRGSISQETLIDHDQPEPFACIRAPLTSGSVGD